MSRLAAIEVESSVFGSAPHRESLPLTSGSGYLKLAFLCFHEYPRMDLHFRYWVAHQVSPFFAIPPGVIVVPLKFLNG